MPDRRRARPKPLPCEDLSLLEHVFTMREQLAGVTHNRNRAVHHRRQELHQMAQRKREPKFSSHQIRTLSWERCKRQTYVGVSPSKTLSTKPKRMTQSAPIQPEEPVLPAEASANVSKPPQPQADNTAGEASKSSGAAGRPHTVITGSGRLLTHSLLVSQMSSPWLPRPPVMAQKRR